MENSVNTSKEHPAEPTATEIPAKSKGGWIVALVIALVVVALIYIPQVVTLPINVVVNGQTVRTTTQASVGSLAETYASEKLVRGDLMSIGGNLLESGGGESYQIKINGAVVDETVHASRSAVITVVKGADKTEPAREENDYTYPRFVKQDHGPFPQVTTPGAVGVKTVLIGEESGERIDKAESAAAIDPIVTYRNAEDVWPKLVALTFDDGPNPGETDSILAVLRKEKIKATFFMLGKNVKAHPEIARRVARAGHQIASHSYSHQPFTKQTGPQIKRELEKTRQTIANATGVDTSWVRPPYGLVNGRAYMVFDEEQAKVALWNVDSRDYTRPGSQRIINTVFFNRKPGAVVLMHDGGGNRRDTVKALRGIIGEYRDKGYRFVTVEQMARYIPALGY